MKLFPTLVVDDFLDNPDYVLNLAESTEYNDPGHTNYPGVTSKKKLYELDQELFDTILQKIFGYYDKSVLLELLKFCLLYTSPSPRDRG